MKKLRALPAWCYLALFALALHLVNLGQESLWYDESFTAYLAKLDFVHMLQAIQGDVHPPLWYVIEWITVRLFGSSEFALRLPAALLGTVAVLLTYRLSLLLSPDKRIALLAGFLAAILPGSLYYSQDARMYPLLAVLVILMAITAIKGKWLFFALFAAGALYTQNLAIIYVAVIGLTGAAIHIRNPYQAIGPVWSAIGIFAAWLPWLPTVFDQLHNVGSGFWIQPLTPGGVVYPMILLSGWRLPDFMQAPILTSLMTFSILSLVVFIRRPLATRAGKVILATIIAVPLALVVISLLWRSVYLYRFLLPSALTMCIPLAYAFFNLRLKTQRQLTAALVAPILLAGVFFHYFPAHNAREDLRSFAAQISQAWHPGDVIYYVSLDTTLVMNYYLPGLPYAMYPHASNLNQALSAETRSAMNLIELDWSDLKSSGYARAWVIAADNGFLTADQGIEIVRLEALPHQTIDYYHKGFITQEILLVQL